MPNKEDMTIYDLYELITETVATKEDLKAFATKEDLNLFRSEVDGRFTKIEGKLDRLEDELLDIKESLRRLENKVQEDGNAFAREIQELKHRIEALETVLLQQKQKNLQPA